MSPSTTLYYRRTLFHWLPYLLLLVSFAACQHTTKLAPVGSPEAGVSTAAEYQMIRTNIDRLQALLVGEFIQQIERVVEGETVYSTWKVNDGKDSILLYSIPVGEPNKIGHWIYHYQILTSLPDEPVYEAFEHLVVVDRDTVRSMYYKAPESFNFPLKELLKTQRNSFKEVELSKLEVDEDGGQYIRQSILNFSNTTIIVPNPQGKDYKKDIYEIKPNVIFYRTIFYKDLEGKEQIEQVGSRFSKVSNFK